jgi:hypothetical protein
VPHFLTRRAPCLPQRNAELSATVADLKRRLAREHEACVAAVKEAKARARVRACNGRIAPETQRK